MEIEWRNADAIQRGLQLLALRYGDEADAALREEAEVEMTEAKKRTPVKSGNLRASGRVLPSERDSGGNVWVSMIFGGVGEWGNVDYAIPVHEDTEVFHRVGQAKYLESVLTQSSPYLVQRVARRLKRIFGGG